MIARLQHDPQPSTYLVRSNQRVLFLTSAFHQLLQRKYCEAGVNDADWKYEHYSKALFLRDVQKDLCRVAIDAVQSMINHNNESV